jgi:hypothetical protein
MRTIQRHVVVTFAYAVLRHGLIVDRAQEAHVAIRSAIRINRPLSDLRFLCAIAFELGTSFAALLSEFGDRLGDESDDLEPIRMKVEQILAWLRGPVDKLDEGADADERFEYPAAKLSDLSDKHKAIARRSFAEWKQLS